MKLLKLELLAAAPYCLFIALMIGGLGAVAAAQSQVPLPPPPTKFDLYRAVSDQLGVNRLVTAVINGDPFLSDRLDSAGIGDISRSPLNQGLPHDIIRDWPGQTRYRLMLVDTEQATQVEAISAKLDKMKADMEAKVRDNNALILGKLNSIIRQMGAAAEPDGSDTTPAAPSSTPPVVAPPPSTAKSSAFKMPAWPK